MRFLKFNDNGEPSLIERNSDDIPAYAILSHAWGADSEEVTFDDLNQGTGKDKPGYDKIRFCAKQSDRDGLRFFWIDTCCINKANFTELSEAINSMFKWYRESTRCYVYFSDVPDHKDPTSTIESAFPNSRWFRRGWTLQELIAPPSVEFFSRSGEPLGSKKSRVQQIHKITRINVEALQGTPLSDFSIDRRISWTKGRETKVEEDAAYCLLGIFDIHMPLIYGEGRQRALGRLRKKVQKSLDLAPFGSDYNDWVAEPVQPTTQLRPHEPVSNLEYRRNSVDTPSPSVAVLKETSYLPYPISAMAFSPNNLLLALVSSEKTELCNAQSGAIIRTLADRFRNKTAVAFSPDSKLLAVVSEDAKIDLWDAFFSKVLRTFEGHSYPLTVVAFSPDGKLLASARSDKTIIIWNTRSGGIIQTLRNSMGVVTSDLAFSPDSKSLALADKTVKLWDIVTGAVLISLGGHLKSVLAVAFSPDGKLLASASSDTTVRVWDARSGKALQYLTGHLESVLAVKFLPDGKLLASVSRDETVKLWDPRSGAVVKTLEGPSGSISAAAFSLDCKLLISASINGLVNQTVDLWHI